MIKKTVYLTTTIVCLFSIAMGDVWDKEIKDQYLIGDSKAHAEYLSKSLAINDLDKLFRSTNKGDFISFCFYAEKSVKNIMEIKTRDENLEKLFYEGLDDPRPGFRIDNDIIYSSPSVLCAIYLSKITKYNQWLKQTSVDIYIEPSFTFSQNEIPKLKNWYKNIYLPSVVAGQENKEVINFEEKELNRHSEPNRIEIQSSQKKVYSRSSKETNSSITSGTILILTLGGFILLLVLAFLVTATRKRHD